MKLLILGGMVLLSGLVLARPTSPNIKDPKNKIETKVTKKEYKIYLAGPEVFMPHPVEKGLKKREIIEKFNKEVLKYANFKFVGLYPLDGEIDIQFNPETAMKIFNANVKLMNQSDLVIANMTRFRGPSMDVGTAFEMGFMYAAGKPVFGYYNMAETYCTTDQLALTTFDCTGDDSNEQTLYTEKVESFGQGYFINSLFSQGRDRFTHLIEDFKLSDNLMMVGAVRAVSGKKLGYAMAGSFLAALHEAAEVFGNLQSLLPGLPSPCPGPWMPRPPWGSAWSLASSWGSAALGKWNL